MNKNYPILHAVLDVSGTMKQVASLAAKYNKKYNKILYLNNEYKNWLHIKYVTESIPHLLFD